MKYAIDYIEDEIVTCENIETKEKIALTKSDIKGNIHEGAIIKKIGSTFMVDSQEEEKRRQLLQEKLNYLKGLKKDL